MYYRISRDIIIYWNQKLRALLAQKNQLDTFKVSKKMFSLFRKIDFFGFKNPDLKSEKNIKALCEAGLVEKIEENEFLPFGSRLDGVEHVEPNQVLYWTPRSLILKTSKTSTLKIRQRYPNENEYRLALEHLFGNTLYSWSIFGDFILEKRPYFQGNRLDSPYNLPSKLPTLDISLQLVKLVQSMHDKGFLHGDIHPGNIIIDLKSKKTTFIDFETSQSLGKQSFAQITGAKEFCAPEVLSKHFCSEKSDIYALCKTILFLIENTSSFNNSVPSKETIQILKEGCHEDINKRASLCTIKQSLEKITKYYL